jgi:hypothetical protein
VPMPPLEGLARTHTGEGLFLGCYQPIDLVSMKPTRPIADRTSMMSRSKPPKNRCVAISRKIYHPLGFRNGYSFAFWFVLAGAMLGFVLARFMYFDIDGVFCNTTRRSGGNSALPGECYYYRQPGRDRVGLLLHLAGVLPAGLLVGLQFLPAVRHKLLVVHRILGYVLLVLAVVGTAGAHVCAADGCWHGEPHVSRRVGGGLLQHQEAAGRAA